MLPSRTELDEQEQIARIVPPPKVGDPATYHDVVFKAKIPFTVIEVSPTGHEVLIQKDNFEVVSGNMLDGTAKYKFTRSAYGLIIKCTRRQLKRGSRTGAIIYKKADTPTDSPDGLVVFGKREKYVAPNVQGQP